MSESSERSIAPKLCVKGCGFFGIESSQGMCSKCYRDWLKDHPESKETAVAPAAAAAPTEDGTKTVADPVAASEKKVQASKNRCFTCSKKLRLAQIFTCKCDYVFCPEHRYADKHDCTFDYKGHASKLLAKANPTVAPDRITKI